MNRDQNTPAIHSIVVETKNSGISLLRLLSSRFTYLSMEQWIGEIEQGRVRVNGRECGSQRIMEAGETIEYLPRGIREPDVNGDYRIIHRTADYLVINKPPNLPSHPGGIYRNNTLWSMLKTRFPEVTMVNRLDRETSGIIVAALTPRGRWLFQSEERRYGQIKKYLVMVHGRIEDSFDADGWIFQDRSSIIRKKQRFSPSFPDGIPAKSAETRFRSLCSNSEYSLLAAELRTGRTHQIRATLSSLGYPVVGDKIYGPEEEIFLRFISGELENADRETLILDHQALHSAVLCFPPDASQKKSDSGAADGQGRECFAAALPADYSGLIQREFSLNLRDPGEIRLLCL
ncbi:RluA family pseudouridine synthase [Salinispira pacifica]|uniref:Ribosomal large subunit pseudouridine synthase D n=1 Tax=Salinispira pacifica TaxID=1307761 RepID=V5WMB3_9SPIO|nr:RluA family pseudouridine synthase [Salinispira pacifica]AHC16286.1 Ribosomal large subunit pseudouridine synthase D [Salinispira pacifica]